MTEQIAPQVENTKQCRVRQDDTRIVSSLNHQSPDDIVDTSNKTCAPAHQKFEAKAHIGKEKFKERLEYGLEAQRKMVNELTKRNIKILNSDFMEFQEDMPKVEIPEPDIEIDTVLIEVRRQEFYKKMLLGYTKKLDGWMHWSKKKNKPLYFVVVSHDLKRLGWVNLTKHRRAVHKQQNLAGDWDYWISIRHFSIKKFDQALDDLFWVIGRDATSE